MRRIGRGSILTDKFDYSPLQARVDVNEWFAPKLPIEVETSG